MSHIPAIWRLFLVFIIVLWFIRRKVTLGSSFLAGAVILGFSFGLPGHLMIRSMISSITHPKTLSLTAVVTGILILSHSMEAAGQMGRLLERFRGLIRSPRLKMIVFPAMIGLLPMPGGAVFSAPMVKTLGKRLALSSSQLSYINYWFRHIWEYWWPLYPGVLLTMTLAHLDLWFFVLFLSPLTVVALLAGYVPLRGLDFSAGRGEEDPAGPRPSMKPFLFELVPIMMVIILGIILGMVLSAVFRPFPPLAGIAKEAGLVLALIAAIGLVWRRNSFSASDKWKVIGKRQLPQMIYMVFAIFIFKGILEDSQAVGAISGELLKIGIPLMPISVIFPFLVGSVVGLTIGFVGTTFPVLIALINSFGENQYIPGYMMLALVSGFLGVLLSPLHLCLLLSNEYFSADLGEVYRYLWMPCLILLFAGISYFWLVRWLPLL